MNEMKTKQLDVHSQLKDKNGPRGDRVLKHRLASSWKLLTVATGVVTLAGCAVQPRPMSSDERQAMLRDDQKLMFADQEPVKKPITLEAAMARALKYNLDHRVKLMSEALAKRQLDMSNVDLLPKLAAKAGYTTRDNVLASSSEDIVSGTQSLVPSTSTEKQLHHADLSFSWNILDFGVSYYGAQQQADRVLVAEQERRKVIQMLMQQVRQAYWQAVGAQRLESQIEPLLAQAQKALDNSQTIEKEGLSSPLSELSYQRELLDLVLQLQSIRDQLLQAKPKLAAIMNIKPGQKFTLAAPDKFQVPQLAIAPDKLEQVALTTRPEIVEAGYKERIGLNETHKAMARLLPGVEVNLGAHYDSNKFLVNDSWRDAGLQVSWNLLNVLNASRIKAAAKAQYDLARERRLALNMAVLTQVHVAWIDYTGQQKRFALVQQLDKVEQSILNHTRNAAAASAKGRMSEIRAATSALMAELRLYQSYASLQGAYGQMVASLGLDPVPKAVKGYDLQTLEQAISKTERKWMTTSVVVGAAQ